MTSYSLNPVSPLGGFDQTWDDLRLREVTDHSLLSLAIPLDGEKAFKTYLKSAFGLGIAAPGSSETKDEKTLLGLARDQFFLLMPFAETPLSPELLSAVKGQAHLTDQSDSWAHLQISGQGIRDALERICPISLHPDEFAIGSVARTSMEHLNAIIWRTDQDTFHLMSARSSAHSFLHALTTSIENTI